MLVGEIAKTMWMLKKHTHKKNRQQNGYYCLHNSIGNQSM